jgi:hypothetical protein
LDHPSNRISVGLWVVTSGGIQVDQVQTFGPRVLPTASEFDWIVAEGGLLIVITLAKPNWFAVPEINCGPNFHDFQRGLTRGRNLPEQ